MVHKNLSYDNIYDSTIYDLNVYDSTNKTNHWNLKNHTEMIFYKLSLLAPYNWKIQ